MFGSILGTGTGTNTTLLGKAELNKSTFGTIDVSQIASQTQPKPLAAQPIFGGATVTGAATFGSVSAQNPSQPATFGSLGQKPPQQNLFASGAISQPVAGGSTNLFGGQGPAFQQQP